MKKSLIINLESSSNSAGKSSNLFCRTKKTSVPYCKSTLLQSAKKMCANRVPKLYSDPKLVQGKRWYIEFYFQDPTGKMKRFRIFEHISKKKLSLAAAILTELTEALQNGYNPFIDPEKILPKEWTIQQAVLYFKQKVGDRGLEKTSLLKYNRTIDRFIVWLAKKGLQFKDADQITKANIESYLSEVKQEGGWTNRGYNNERDFIKSAFIFMQEQGIIKVNPCADIKPQKTVATKHKFYDEKTLAKVRALMLKHDPYLFFACECVYYLCIRSEKELKHFKVGNIFPERKQVLISGSDSKTDQDRFIPCPDEMMNIFKERILKFDPNCYVFSAPPSGSHFKGLCDPGKKPFGVGFFSKRFSKIRRLAGLSSDYTIFSFRHTRAVHLKMDGATDQQIMLVMGHKDFATTARYLRDIGLTVSGEGINNITRKF